jgi:tetratricopeptide (TPR) repeat protein
MGALIDYNKALDLSPALDIYNNRGTVKKGLNDYYGAIADYDIAIRLSPKNPAAYINRGLAKQKLGDKNGMCMDWSKAGELGEIVAYDLIKKYCN